MNARLSIAPAVRAGGWTVVVIEAVEATVDRSDQAIWCWARKEPHAVVAVSADGVAHAFDAAGLPTPLAPLLAALPPLAAALG